MSNEQVLDSLADLVAGRLRPVDRIALTREEAAEALGGMSTDSFERYVQPEVKLIRRGRLRLVPVAELERWVEENAERVLEGSR